MKRGAPRARPAFVLGDSIDRTAIAEAVQLLGYDSHDVLRVEMDPATVTVTVWARAADGRRLGMTRNHRHVIR